MIRTRRTRGRYCWLLATLFAGCNGYTNYLRTNVKTGMTKAKVLEQNPWPLSRYNSSSGYSSSLRYLVANGSISLKFRNGVLTGWTQSLRR